MSDIEQLLTEMMKEGATFWAQDGQVRFHAPKGVVTEERLAAIRAGKARALDYLNEIKRTAPPIDPSDEMPLHGLTVAPLSHAQMRVWLVESMEAAGPAYNVPVSIQITGDLAVPALERSLSEIVSRHEALRTRFVVIDGIPQQVIDPARELALERVDLTGLDEAERETAVRQWTHSMACTPFRLDSDSLLRFILLKQSSDRYLFLLCMHHAVSDGWSMAVFVGELTALYKAFLNGEGSPLPPLRAQYSDYALWERSRLSEEFFAKHIAYWREQLAGAPMATELPCDFPRPPVQQFRGSEVAFSLPDAISRQWRALVREERTTLFTGLLAAFNVLLFRWSGQGDLIIGTPVSGRNHRQTEALIGLFVNMLPIRSRIDANMSFRQLLRDVARVTLEAYAHQEVPFERLVALTIAPRERSRQPLFQVAAVYESMPQPAPQLPNLRLQQARTTSGTAKFDLTLFLQEDSGGAIRGYVEYATDLFQRTTIEQLIARYERLLRQVAEQPDGRVGQLSMLSEADQQLLRSWNDTTTDYPRDKTVHEVFEERAGHEPERAAVLCEGQCLTYSQLNRRANQLAHYLRTRGVGPDRLVGVCMDRGLSMVVAILGILKAGGAYLPLDPGCPRERMREILADARPELLLVQQHLVKRLPDESWPVFLIDEQWDQLTPHSTENIEADETGCSSHHLAYVMYTSGSTGKPKGVMVEHRNVLRLVINNPYAPISLSDRVVHCSNPAFDASTWEMWAGLLQGASVLVIPQPVLLDPVLFSRALSDGGATALWLTVGLFNEYVDKLSGALARLNVLIIGGDALDPRTVARLVHSGQAPRLLLNGYGPTESTTFATTFEIKAVPDGARTIPIGRPIANTRIHILDAAGQEVPVGARGEIYIAGEGVARGYLNRPELTAERFAPDRFSSNPADRMYRTGDMGLWRSDGNIEYLGRNDDQVKLRGFRIELGDIEAHLMRYAAVREALVTVRAEPSGDKRLIAYFTPVPGAEPDITELRRFLKQRLPEYMIPAAWVRLESFPLTSNGKVDRAALPVVDTAISREGTDAQPTTDIERALADAWREVLMRDGIGLHDNFFELGGNSLLAVRALMKAAGRLSMRIPMSVLYEAPTIAGIAEALQAQLIGTGGDCVVRLRPVDSREPPLFLVHPIGGHLLGYRHVVPALDGRRAVYGLQRPEVHGGDEPMLRSIQDLAALYVDQILQMPIDAPYVLCGWSFGGIVALEMALRLQERGKAVRYVGVIDTVLPVQEQMLAPSEIDVLRQWQGREVSGVLPQLPLRLQKDLEDIMAAEADAGASNVAGSAGSDLFRKLYTANLWALYTYRAAIRLNTIHVYCARQSETSAGYAASLARMEALSRDGLIVRHLEGDHYSVVAPPFAASLCRSIESDIAAAIA